MMIMRKRRRKGRGEGGGRGGGVEEAKKGKNSLVEKKNK